jgi:predicted Zn-dependent protease with MMP-like domain/Tfp pilus assembly protein PilF
MSEDEKLDTDAITAHLDRGWDMVQKGDLARAELSARHVIELDADSPEGHTLLGAIAAGKGDTEEAIDHYTRATELDPEFVDPLLYAAEAWLQPPGDIEEALRLCDEALAVAEEEDEYLDALLLKAEVLLQKGDDDEARTLVTELPPPATDLPDVHYHLRAGRIFLDLGDLEKAEGQFTRALAREPSLTDASHALAIVYEERGDLKKMVKTFLAVRTADLKEPAPPWGVTRERFEEIAEQSLAELPEKIRKLLENVPILVADYPAIELVAEGNDPRMMGFFSGVPYPEKSVLDAPPAHLDTVFLYQRNIERFARTAAEVEDEIRKTLLHETGHFFGLTEEELEAMGLG